MLPPIIRENILNVLVVVSILLSVYLYKELNKIKLELQLHKPVSPAPVNDVIKRKPILVKKSVTVREPVVEEDVGEEITE
jgi:hypothetical protein